MSIFLPYHTQYKEFTDPIENNSINGVALHLGYAPTLIYTYHALHTDKKISTITFEIFSKNILFVDGMSGVQNITPEDVHHFLKDFILENVYDSYEVEYTLEAGIKNKSLSIEYLSKILNIGNPNPNGLFFIEKFGVNLFFIDGLLVDFQTSDGLNKWAKQWKNLNITFFKKYEDLGKLYWDNNLPMIIKEINRQADAYSEIPHGFKNEFIPFHRSKYGTINFLMLQVCHYNKQITLSDFLELNHGRYKELLQKYGQNLINIKRYQLDNFTYEFMSENEMLISCFLNNK